MKEPNLEQPEAFPRAFDECDREPMLIDDLEYLLTCLVGASVRLAQYGEDADRQAIENYIQRIKELYTPPPEPPAFVETPSSTVEGFIDKAPMPQD